MHSPILAPVIVLVLWSLVMLAWLYSTRLPAMIKGNITYDPRQPSEAFQARLPVNVRWKADNYNHLMEQPTLFYAVSLTLAWLGAGGGSNAMLAWTYVGLRIAHSLVHAIVNIVILRFTLFIAASLVLLILAIRAAIIIF